MLELRGLFMMSGLVAGEQQKREKKFSFSPEPVNCSPERPIKSNKLLICIVGDGKQK
jgi:hypothetical protein